MKKFALIALLSATVIFAQAAKIAEARAKMKEKKFDEAISVMEAAHKSAPKDPAVAKALAETYVAKGNSVMYDDALPPFKKYPEALRTFRKALEFDKDNPKAKANIAQIEAIYKSMGRPIPQ